MQIEQTWRPITVPVYSEFYEVSDQGNVRSVDRVTINKNGRPMRWPDLIVRPSVNGSKGRKKYLGVCLCVCGRIRRFLVHRLVAMAFIPNPGDLPEVNHIDGVKMNNVVANLEWCSSAANREHAVRMGLIFPPPDKTKLSNADVAAIRTMAAEGMLQKDIALRFSVSGGTISLIVNNKHRVKPRLEAGDTSGC